MAKSTNQGGGVFADINITPLTDVFLVLLIIFMVTTAVTIESAAHVDLPKAEPAAANEKPKGVLVTYTTDHRILVNQQAVTFASLAPVLRTALGRSSDKLVVFEGDPQVLLGDMVHILDIAKSAGAEAIAIAVAQLPPGAAPASGGGGVQGGAPGAM